MEGGWHWGEQRLPAAAGVAGAPTAQRRPPPPRPWAHRRTEKSWDRAPVRAALHVDLRSQPSPPRGLQTWPLHRRHPAPPSPGAQLPHAPTRPASRAGGSAPGPSITFLWGRPSGKSGTQTAHLSPLQGAAGNLCYTLCKDSAPRQETLLPRWALPAHARYRPSPCLMCPPLVPPGTAQQARAPHPHLRVALGEDSAQPMALKTDSSWRTCESVDVCVWLCACVCACVVPALPAMTPHPRKNVLYFKSNNGTSKSLGTERALWTSASNLPLPWFLHLSNELK